MRRLTDEEHHRNSSTLDTLVELFPEPRRTKVFDMLDSPLGEEYYVAPGSSKLEYHDCFVGGLLDHSLTVVKNINKIAKALAPGKYPDHQLAFVGLFHDLGKAGDGDHPHYVQNPSDWHREKLGKMYEVNKEGLYMPTSERGLFALQRFGIELSAEEWVAIRLNDGMYVDENRPYAMKEPTLALLLHWADRAAAGDSKKDQGEA